MKELLDSINALPLLVKIILGIITFPLGLILVILAYSLKMQEMENAILDNPNEQNVTALLDCLSNSVLGFNNHPSTWQELRGLWNVVNRSAMVTTATKEKFLAVLMRKGLFMNDTRVIDNYAPAYTDENYPNFSEQAEVN